MRAGLPLREVAPPRLEPGACALLIYEQDEDGEPRLLMGVHGQPRIATVQMWRRRVDMESVAWAGDPTLGFYPQQTFRKYGVEVRLSLRLIKTAQGAAALAPTGSLEYVADEGWSLVTPVVGVATCEPPRRPPA